MNAGERILVAALRSIAAPSAAAVPSNTCPACGEGAGVPPKVRKIAVDALRQAGYSAPGVTPKCDVITCPGQAYPGITLCLGHARQLHGDLVPAGVMVSCAECGDPTTTPFPQSGTQGLCAACCYKKLIAGGEVL